VARLTDEQRALLHRTRRAVLGTASPSGRPRLVPIAFAVVEAGPDLTVYSALDEKPKTVGDPRDLARVRDIRARPQVALLVDEWHEDWRRLSWLRLDGHATLLEPDDAGAREHAAAVAVLRERYPQYAAHSLEDRPMLRVRIDGVTGWSAAAK
jgi:PPOX class probable F420-dependent enzyme